MSCVPECVTSIFSPKFSYMIYSAASNNSIILGVLIVPICYMYGIPLIRYTIGTVYHWYGIPLVSYHT